MGTLFYVSLAILVFIVVSVTTYVSISLVVIKASEKAVMFTLGQAVEVLDPGLHFCARWYTRIVRYTMAPLILQIKVPTAITKNGKVRDYKEDGDEIEKAEVDIYLTLVTYFSDNETDLMKTAKRVPSSNYAKVLSSTIKPFVIDVARSVFAEMPWVLSYQERKNVLDYMLSKIVPEYEYFKLTHKPLSNGNKYKTYYFDNVVSRGETADQMERYNPLVQFALDLSRTTLMIDDINFCNPDLANSLSLAEAARLQSEADRVKNLREASSIRQIGYAEADVANEKGLAENDVIMKRGTIEAEIIQKKGAAQADARERMVKVIKDNPDLEFLRSLEEMAKGTSNTILYQIPGAFEDKISKILGGNKPADFLGLLKDPEIMKALKEAVEKITNK